MVIKSLVSQLPVRFDSLVVKQRARESQGHGVGLVLFNSSEAQTVYVVCFHYIVHSNIKKIRTYSGLPNFSEVHRRPPVEEPQAEAVGTAL